MKQCYKIPQHIYIGNQLERTMCFMTNRSQMPNLIPNQLLIKSKVKLPDHADQNSSKTRQCTKYHGNTHSKEYI